MKHIFVVNPAAGKRDMTERLAAAARALRERHGLDVELVLTRHAGHALELVRSIAAKGGAVRFYACGGDGTAGEVANAVVGCENAAMTCIPSGTGNDFLKNFGEDARKFSDPEALFDGPQFPLDVIDCNGRCALTIACSGFDAQVAADVHRFSHIPFLRGKGGYVLSLGANFLARPLGRSWTVTLDGAAEKGEFVLCAVCNGRYYGGGFMPMAEARMDDGVLNVMVVPLLSRAAFLRFVAAYSRGRYYEFPDLARGRTAREIVIESEEEFVTCLDGEAVRHRRAVFKLAKGKVNFFGPAGCDPNATCREVPVPAGV